MRGHYGTARTLIGAEGANQQRSSSIMPILMVGGIGAVIIAVVRDEHRAAKAR